MRLTHSERVAIQSVIANIIGTDSEVWLFGSRMDDTKQGGDVDLFIESDVPLSFIQRAQIKMALESRLGLPVDIVSKARNAMPTPFQTIARANAARLEL
jgi:predicted nucleotidyltransferase